ncbi:MAG: ATP-binding protein [Acidimicrobiia bacterium]|jgi:histidine kinase
MSRWRRLDVRLFGSYVLVGLMAVVTLVLAIAIRAPDLFTARIREAGEHGEIEAESRAAFGHALRSALPVAIVLSALVAALFALFVARRILRPVGQVRAATRRLAEGHYDERVAEPAELELAALARDVNRLAEALETTERRRARLISEVAHEMRTPLTVANGYVEGVLDGVFEPSEEVLSSVAEELARLQRLASDLATLSRAEEGAIDLDLVDLDLRELTETAVTRLRPQYDDKGVGIAVADGPALPVRVDRDRVLQILTNLLGNALTYTPSGGAVEVVPARGADRVSVEVRDDGVGIAPADLDLVFERFYRVSGLDRPPGGSGIGLTVARGIARAHHGDIRASSPGVGQGAVFTLSLPVAAP